MKGNMLILFISLVIPLSLPLLSSLYFFCFPDPTLLRLVIILFPIFRVLSSSSIFLSTFCNFVLSLYLHFRCFSWRLYIIIQVISSALSSYSFLTFLLLPLLPVCLGSLAHVSLSFLIQSTSLCHPPSLISDSSSSVNLLPTRLFLNLPSLSQNLPPAFFSSDHPFLSSLRPLSSSSTQSFTPSFPRLHVIFLHLVLYSIPPSLLFLSGHHL